MKKQTPSSITNRKRLSFGSLVGAIIGGVGQFGAAVFFLHYALNWGGPFFRQDGGGGLLAILLFPLSWLFFLVFAALGAVAGAVGGMTHRIVRGAAVSGVMCGLFWLTLLVVPVHIVIGLSGGGLSKEPTNMPELTIALVTAISVGAIAGVIGAIAKNRLMPKR
ncbi:MAG: hypothetical protein Fur0046_25480 [Cyanobacteria bacterium J069]|nr:MAG: hypothetical protein D6742_05335 [Cyanobacteria bacterium J069]